MKPQIAIFFTGGTISMRVDPKSGGPVPALSGEEIVAQVPGLDEIADFKIINFAKLPGPHITPPKMLELARDVAGMLADPHIAGVVVTHGTDTLEETANEGAGRQLKRMGVILGSMVPSHKARIKLMAALGAGWSVEKIGASFEE